MKKILKSRRKYGVLILTLVLVLSVTINVSAIDVWAPLLIYNSPEDIQAEESWIGYKQCVEFYSNNILIKKVAGEGHTLWINDVPVLDTLYDTTYWCFDTSGDIFAIDTEQRLLICPAGSAAFWVYDGFYNCTGFQRYDNIGSYVYTDGGNFYLNDLFP